MSLRRKSQQTTYDDDDDENGNEWREKEDIKCILFTMLVANVSNHSQIILMKLFCCIFSQLCIHIP